MGLDLDEIRSLKLKIEKTTIKAKTRFSDCHFLALFLSLSGDRALKIKESVIPAGCDN